MTDSCANRNITELLGCIPHQSTSTCKNISCLQKAQSDTNSLRHHAGCLQTHKTLWFSCGCDNYIHALSAK